MYFEFRQEWRMPASGRMYCRWGVRQVVGRCMSAGWQCQGGHTYAYDAGKRFHAVMSKIVSWLWPGASRRKPESKLNRTETLDKDHRPTALGTSPEWSW